VNSINNAVIQTPTPIKPISIKVNNILIASYKTLENLPCFFNNNNIDESIIITNGVKSNGEPIK
jgi:hypothetical protein